MTKHKDFLSSDDAGKVQDIKNLDTELGGVATVLGIEPAVVTQTADDAKVADWIYNVNETSKHEVHQITKLKDALFSGPEDTPVQPITLSTPPVAPAVLKAGIFRRYRNTVKKIKASDNYTEQIGKLLGIEGPEVVIDQDALKPKATLRVSAFNRVEIDIVKGPAGRIIVRSYVYKPGEPVPADPGTEIVWDTVAVLEHPPFVDHRLNQTRHPETRLFQFLYVINDKVVGQPSDILRVVAEVYESFDGAELSGKVK